MKGVGGVGVRVLHHCRPLKWGEGGGGRGSNKCQIERYVNVECSLHDLHVFTKKNKKPIKIK